MNRYRAAGAAAVTVVLIGLEVAGYIDCRGGSSSRPCGSNSGYSSCAWRSISCCGPSYEAKPVSRARRKSENRARR